MTKASNPIPKPVDPTRLKLTSDDGAQGALLGVKCGDCGVYAFGAAIYCQACTSAALEQVELGSHGTLYSYTQVHVPPAGWPGPVPYVLGQVELPQGPHVLAEIVECEPERLSIGLELHLTLRPVRMEGSEDCVMVYKFRPAGERPVT